MESGKKKRRAIYMIAMENPIISKICRSEEELEEFLSKYNSYCMKNKTKIIYTDLKTDRTKYKGLIEVSARVLERLEDAQRTLEELDEITTSKRNAKEVKEAFGINDEKGRSLTIAYKIGFVRTIPVFYQDKKDYLNKDCLEDIMVRHALKSKGFIDKINYHKAFNDDVSMGYRLESLLCASARYEEFLLIESDSNIAVARNEMIRELISFINAWCYPKNKKGGGSSFSYRRLRDLAAFTIQFEKDLEKREIKKAEEHKGSTLSSSKPKPQENKNDDATEKLSEYVQLSFDLSKCLK